MKLPSNTALHIHRTRLSETCAFSGSFRGAGVDGGLDRCILYCILFVFMLELLCFCVATEFSVNKDLYKKTAGIGARA